MQAVSIIIVNYNTKSLTQKCIDSIKKYETELKLEIILVDNGSKDGSKEHFSKIKNIKYLYNDTNAGFAKANNIGAKIASHNVLFFLNSDTETIDSSLKTAVKFLTDNPEVGLVGAKLYNSDMSLQSSCYNDQTIINALKEYVLGHKKSFSKFSPFETTPIQVFAVVGAAVGIRKELFWSIGGWDERYFMYFEDLELCRKVNKLHKKVVYLPSWSLIHHHGKSGEGNQTHSSWKKLVPSSKTYHGNLKHTLLFIIIWLTQKIHIQSN